MGVNKAVMTNQPRCAGKHTSIVLETRSQLNYDEIYIVIILLQDCEIGLINLLLVVWFSIYKADTSIYVTCTTAL